MDKSFLESCGINILGLNPNNIRVFGNGEGRLPESNSEYRTDDLAENAVVVFGGDDNRFDEGDYVLFYGWGPHKRYLLDNRFYSDKNIYSDQSYYYINISPSEESIRVPSLVSADIGSHDKQVS